MKDWVDQNPTLRNMRSDVNKSSYVSEDCPDDAIQVDYHIYDTKQGKFKSGHFFSEAKAPDFMDNGPNTLGTKMPDLYGDGHETPAE